MPHEDGLTGRQTSDAAVANAGLSPTPAPAFDDTLMMADDVARSEDDPTTTPPHLSVHTILKGLNLTPEDFVVVSSRQAGREAGRQADGQHTRRGCKRQLD